jgi:RNA polymerase sigma-70 factor (ECF subfamily)
MIPSLDPYIIQQASCRASLLVATAGFKSQDWEDLRHEMIVDCLRRLPKFDPARGDWHGFVRGVVRNHATVLVTRGHRRAQREVVAEELSHRAAGDDSLDSLDGIKRHEIERGILLTIDVERVLRGLPSQLRTLARLLSELRIVEVCAKTGKSRSRVYQMTRQLRDAFIAAGFRPRCPTKSAAGWSNSLRGREARH